VAGIAVEAMMAMALQSNGLARMVMRRDGQWSTFSIVFET
jgi:muconolactone delta-isomerase